MLRQPLRTFLATLLFGCCALPALAQVRVQTPVRFTGVPGERAIDGLGAPAMGSAAMTVQSAVLESWRWCSVAMVGDTIELSLVPAVEQLQDGLMARFQVPQDLSGVLWARIQGFGTGRILRTDALAPVPGQLITGRIAEVLWANGAFTLLNLAEGGCPPGSISVNERFCIDTISAPSVGMFDAMDQCAERGGKLCSWEEYYAGCVLLGTQLGGMYNNWEWVDETANHLQTFGQAGRFTCQSQRTTGPGFGDVRCCYHKR